MHLLIHFFSLIERVLVAFAELAGWAFRDDVLPRAQLLHALAGILCAMKTIGFARAP